MGGWSLVSSNEMHEAQAKEFLDFLASLYGREFAEKAAQEAVANAVAEGDSIVRVFRIFDAAHLPKPPYVREHERHFRTKGVEASSSGRRQMASRLRDWYERWS
jgi:methyl coenzyme M reductase gamma subunit